MVNLPKPRLLPCVIGVVLVCLSGCHRINERVIGSGVRQTEKRDVHPFTSILTEGAFDIEIICQKQQSLEVEADENVLARVTTEVTNGVLHIRSVGVLSLQEPIKVRITVPDLEGLSASGAGTIKISELKNDRFEIDANGAPTVEVSGITKVAEIGTNGAAQIDAHRLRAETAVVHSNGASRIEVYASDSLEVTIGGPSHVIYSGNPEVSKSISGPATLEHRYEGGT